MMTTRTWWCLQLTCSCLWLQTQGLVVPPSAICTARLQPSDRGQITMCEDFQQRHGVLLLERTILVQFHSFYRKKINNFLQVVNSFIHVKQGNEFQVGQSPLTSGSLRMKGTAKQVSHCNIKVDVREMVVSNLALISDAKQGIQHPAVPPLQKQSRNLTLSDKGDHNICSLITTTNYGPPSIDGDYQRLFS